MEEHEAGQTAAGSNEWLPGWPEWERVGNGWLDGTALKQQVQAEEEEVGLTE